MKIRPLLLSLILLPLAACTKTGSPISEANAGEASAVTTTVAAVPNNVEETIRASLKQAIPDITVSSIRTTPFAGLYEVRVKGYGPAYVSADGKFMLQGELIQLNGKDVVNLTETVMEQERKAALAAVDKKDMIVFPATGPTKAVAYVFTDVDCGYCRKLHNEMADINRLGIEIRYLAFPRAGVPSTTAQRMQAVWCSANPAQALTQAKQGVAIASASCNDPIRKEFELGHQLGVTGTPAVFTADGVQIGGYLPPAQLAKALSVK